MEILRDSHAAYQASGLIRAPEKGIGLSSPGTAAEPSRRATKFVALGTEVNGIRGTVGAPRAKRAGSCMHRRGYAAGAGWRSGS